MSLWSATVIRAAKACVRRGYRTRRGDVGEDWPGYEVGRVLHEHIAARLDPTLETTPIGLLSPLHQVEVRAMLARAESQGWLAEVPEHAAIEETYSARLDVDGDPRFAPAEGWTAARNYTSCPPDETWYRLSPDAWWFGDDDALEVIDWKSAMGMGSDAALARDPQVVTYCGALALLRDVFPDTRVRFRMVNLRFGVVQQAEASAEDWLAAARPLWAACVEQDRQGEALDERLAPGPHCSICAHRARCKPNEAQTPGATYRRQQWHAAEASRLRSDLSAMLRELPATVQLDDGTVLGPQQTERVTLPRTSKKCPEGKKPALRAVADALVGEGHDPMDWFGPTESVGKWAAKLPAPAAEVLEPHLSRGTTTTYITRPEADWLAEWAGEAEGNNESEE